MRAVLNSGSNSKIMRPSKSPSGSLSSLVSSKKAVKSDSLSSTSRSASTEVPLSVEKYLLSLKVCDVPCVPHVGTIVPARLVKVYDGDTINVIIALGNNCPLAIKVRVVGIDAPEITKKGTTTQLEKDAGLFVRDYVNNLFQITEIVQIKLHCIDKYGGRYVGDVFLADNKTLSDHLLSLGYVKKYDGKTKTKWQEDELKKILNR